MGGYSRGSRGSASSDNSEPFARLYHKKTTEGGTLFELQIPNCGPPCTLRKLRETRKAFIIGVPRWKEECEGSKKDKQNPNFHLLKSGGRTKQLALKYVAGGGGGGNSGSKRPVVATKSTGTPANKKVCLNQHGEQVDDDHEEMPAAQENSGNSGIFVVDDLSDGKELNKLRVINTYNEEEMTSRAKMVVARLCGPTRAFSSCWKLFDSHNQFPFDARNKDPSEKTKPVEVPDVEVGAFKAMLSFIYVDDVSGLNGDNAIAVLYAAKKYDLPELVDSCLNFPKEKLSNVFLAFDETRFLEELEICPAEQRSWHILTHEIWPFVSNKLYKIAGSKDNVFLLRLRQHFGATVLRDCANLRFIECSDVFPEFPAVADHCSAAYGCSLGQALAKWLLTPREDGRPILLCGTWRKPTIWKLDDLKKAFSIATTPVNFIVRLPFACFNGAPFVLVNEQMRERLSMRKCNGGWLLKRLAFGLNAKRWMEWPREAIFYYEINNHLVVSFDDQNIDWWTDHFPPSEQPMKMNEDGKMR
ncbi:BTB/POZ domain-containing protein 3 [Globodera pallida]|nr:BTB/POZ domain-containing protein 3 [Globodera pallida]